MPLISSGTNQSDDGMNREYESEGDLAYENDHREG